MKHLTTRAAVLMTAVVVALPMSMGAAHAQPARSGGLWDNCTNYNHKWPHGVGRDKAHDHTTGTPVRDFKHSTRIYNIAMHHNSGLDRDKDGIACEKA